MVIPDKDLCEDCNAEGEFSEFCHYCGGSLCDECARPSGYPICEQCEQDEADEEE